MHEKTTIIILHGWGLTGEHFLPLQNELKKFGFTVFAPTFPGFGDYKLSQVYTLSDYALFLKTFIHKERIENPVLIGHSFGGRVAILFAATYPTVVSKIILTGTPGFSPTHPIRLVVSILLGKIGKMLVQLSPFRFLEEAIRKRYYSFVGAREYVKADPLLAETFKNIVAEELVEPMKKIKMPCLLVWGKQDKMVPLFVAYKMMHTISGSHVMTLPLAGHGAAYKNSKDFVSTVLPFLKTD